MGMTYAELGVYGVSFHHSNLKLIVLANQLLVPAKGIQVRPVVDVREATALVGE